MKTSGVGYAAALVVAGLAFVWSPLMTWLHSHTTLGAVLGVVVAAPAAVYIWTQLRGGRRR